MLNELTERPIIRPTFHFEAHSYPRDLTACIRVVPKMEVAKDVVLTDELTLAHLNF
jgi:hypothetical protein